MFKQSSITKSALLSIALMLSATSALSAQERLFEWTGRVDGETRVFMRGNDIWTQDVDGRRNRSQARAYRSLPTTNGLVRVQRVDGRGEISVIQQPNSRNNYTAVIRIRDASRRADRYRFAAYWQGSGRGDYGDIGDRDDRNSRNDGSVRWSGSVDDEVEIRIQGRNVETRRLSGNVVRDVRATLNGRALPRRDLQVSVRERQGRGTVTVVQQPGQYNGYTAVIRINDRQGGYGYYDLDVNW
jgi:redox-regulated HSP33 family molecular chaperone